MNHSGLSNLKTLFWLRNIAILSQVVTILLAIYYFSMSIPVAKLGLVIGLLALFNVLTWIRMSNAKQVSDSELFAQLSVDVAVLTVLLAFTGGASNPFAILYLLPLTMAAIILSSRYTWVYALFTVILYTTIVFYYIPMPHATSHMSEFNLHVIGMWLGFILSAFIISYFVVGLRRTINLQHEHLKRARENELRNEQLVKLGILSASTAHDMGTPLNNLTLIIDDIKHDAAINDIELQEKIDIMEDQVRRCRDALAKLAHSTGNVVLQGGKNRNLTNYVQELIGKWKANYPAIDVRLSIQLNHADSSLIVDKALDHALINILDNAAQASPERVDVVLENDNSKCILSIKDCGPGISNIQQESLGKMTIDSNKGGMGLGVYLSNAIIDRLGGLVSFSNRLEGGLCTRIELPMVDINTQNSGAI